MLEASQLKQFQHRQSLLAEFGGKPAVHLGGGGEFIKAAALPKYCQNKTFPCYKSQNLDFKQVSHCIQHILLFQEFLPAVKGNYEVHEFVIAHCKNVRGLEKSMVVFCLFEKL